MNRRLTLILALIVVLLASWRYYLNQTESYAELSRLIKQEGAAEYVGDRIQASVYNLQGSLHYRALAKEVQYFAESERTEFIQPELELFDQEKTKTQWKLTAERAELSKEHILYLTGNVNIESSDSTSRLQKINTETLSIDLNSQDIYSDSQVTSQGQGFTTTGLGLEGNLKTQQTKLKQNVKTFMSPTIIRRSSDKPTTK